MATAVEFYGGPKDGDVVVMPDTPPEVRIAIHRPKDRPEFSVGIYRYDGLGMYRWKGEL